MSKKHEDRFGGPEHRTARIEAEAVGNGPRAMERFDLSASAEVFEMMASALEAFFAGGLTKAEVEIVRKFAETAFKGQSLKGAMSNEASEILQRLAEAQPSQVPSREPEVLDAEVAVEPETVQ